MHTNAHTHTHHTHTNKQTNTHTHTQSQNTHRPTGSTRQQYFAFPHALKYFQNFKILSLTNLLLSDIYYDIIGPNAQLLPGPCIPKVPQTTNVKSTINDKI